MNNHTFTRYILPSLLFSTLFYIIALSFLSGLHSPFLFDDFASLIQLNQFSSIDTYTEILNYLLRDISSPTYRPISRLTFLLEQHSWPTNPEDFKWTNIALHLINGLLLFWLSLRLLSHSKETQQHLYLIATTGTLLWLSHPFWVSTVLYAVQRMAILGTTFTLITLIAYIIARDNIKNNHYKSYTYISLGLTMGGLLALFSKENAVLIPIYILLIETTLLRNSKPLINAWKWLFLYLPSLLLIAYILYNIPSYIDKIYSIRDFTLPDRLLTQTRVMVDYLRQLFIPDLSSMGLLHDEFSISRGLFSPISTFFSCLVLIALLITGWLARKKYPLVSLAILFFYAGHILESTVIPLEMYYEHRNYLPSIFLFFGLTWLLITWRLKFGLAILAIILSLNITLTFQRATLWSHETKLYTKWANQAPSSARVQHILALSQTPKLALITLSNALKYQSNDFALLFQYLISRCAAGQMNTNISTEFTHRISNIIEHKKGIYSFNNYPLLSSLIHLSQKNTCTGLQIPDIQHIVDSLKRFAIRTDNQHHLGLIWHYQGNLYLQNQQVKSAYQAYSKAIALTHDVELGLKQTAKLASFGCSSFALQHLKATEENLRHHQSSERFRKLTSSHYENIVYLKGIIKEDLNNPQITEKCPSH